MKLTIQNALSISVLLVISLSCSTSENSFDFKLISEGNIVTDLGFSQGTAWADYDNDGGNSNGCSWGDYNNDGWIDLFVGNYKDQSNFLYVN